MLYAIFALTRTSETFNKTALHAAYLGMVFQFVSLLEGVLLSGNMTFSLVHNSESLLAFLIMTVFMITHDLKEAFSLGTRMLVFDKVRHDPQAPEAYGARITYDIPLHRRAAASRPRLALVG